MGRFEEVIHARAAWLKANMHHQFAYKSVGKCMRVVAGNEVILNDLTVIGFCDDGSDSTVFDKFIMGIPVEIDLEDPYRFEIIQRPMEYLMAENEVAGTIDPVNMPGLGAERTTAQIVADIIAKDPAAHGVTLAERQRRAADIALAQAKADKEFFDEQETAVVGDAAASTHQPSEEPAVRGRPITVAFSEDGLGQEGEAGEVHHITTAGEDSGASDDGIQVLPGTDAMAGRSNGTDDSPILPATATCEHSWPEPVEEQTPCIYCGLTFDEFANS